MHRYAVLEGKGLSSMVRTNDSDDEIETLVLIIIG
jgi:hypothetical protein